MKQFIGAQRQMPHSIPVQELKATFPLGARILYSNQLKSHLPENLLTADRCAFVTLEQKGRRRIGVYSKESLLAVRFLPDFFSRLISSQTVTSNDDISSGTVVSKYLDPEAFHNTLIQYLKELSCWKQSLVSSANDSWRLSHGDSDAIPGLAIDVYDDITVVQSSGRVGDFLLPFIERALEALGHRVFERSTGQSRRSEGCPERTRWVSPHPPDWTPESQVVGHISGMKLSFFLHKAQKTGLFLDQRLNLEILSNLTKGPGDFLDICSYSGAWSLAAKRSGFTTFTLIDQDNDALALAAQNLEVSQEALTLLHGDMFEHLQLLKRANKAFDAIVADPPAFAKSKKHVPEALRAYARLARLTTPLVRPGGLLVCCSCSRNVEESAFLEAVTSQFEPGQWILVARGQQAPDHTILTGNDHSGYLKCFFFRKLPQNLLGENK